jgi:hypothetical protein
MKTGTIKVAGAAALGVAFAAVAAAPASAAMTDGLVPANGLPKVAAGNALPNPEEAVGGTVSQLGSASDLTNTAGLPTDSLGGAQNRALTPDLPLAGSLPAAQTLPAPDTLPTGAVDDAVTGTTKNLQKLPVEAPTRSQRSMVPSADALGGLSQLTGVAQGLTGGTPLDAARAAVPNQAPAMTAPAAPTAGLPVDSLTDTGLPTDSVAGGLPTDSLPTDVVTGAL